MKINKDRLEQYFNTIWNISSTELGCTRFSYSDEDKKVRGFLFKEFEKLNLEVTVDKLGNIRAKYNPNNLNTPSVLTGSHIDTVKNGGRYDGLLGVVSGLEVIKTIDESNIKLNYPLELIIFAEEEGSNFGVTMLGSKYLAGKIDLEYLKQLKNDEGKTAYEVIEKLGYLKNEDNPIISEKTKCLIEFHIEQGQVLESEGFSIGIVKAIAGMNTLKINMQGISNHAGTTPMKFRKDPLVAASYMIEKLSHIPSNLNLKSNVVTVGKIKVTPNSSNVIPAEVEFYIDVRDVEEVDQEKSIAEINNVFKETLQKYNVEGSIVEIGSSDIVRLSEDIINIIEETAKKENMNYLIINSGAVHDNAMINDITKCGMIFVPSIGGISHSPYEDTDKDDIIEGANLLLKTILNINENY